MSIKHNNKPAELEIKKENQAEKLSTNGLFKLKTNNPVESLDKISDKALGKINPNEVPGDWFVKVDWAYRV